MLHNYSDHGLDFLLCYEIFKRRDALYLGMIGSKTKGEHYIIGLEKKLNNISDVKINR